MFLEDKSKKQTFFYGYVFFRQEKDASIQRGYLQVLIIPFSMIICWISQQKSVVMISKHPFLGLFKTVIGLIGPLFFEYGNPLLEACFQNTGVW